jgi:hypothetical protein
MNRYTTWKNPNRKPVLISAPATSIGWIVLSFHFNKRLARSAVGHFGAGSSLFKLGDLATIGLPLRLDDVADFRFDEIKSAVAAFGAAVEVLGRWTNDPTQRSLLPDWKIPAPHLKVVASDRFHHF